VKEKMNRKKRMLALVGSVMLALLGTLGLVKYVQSARNRVVNSETTSKIFVAKSSIKAGTSSKDLALRVEAIGVPERLQQPGAVKNLDEIKDLVNTTDLLQGEQLIKAHIGRMGDGSRKLMNVAEVTGMESSVIQLNDLFALEHDSDGAVRQSMPTGIRPSFETRLRRHGVELGPDLTPVVAKPKDQLRVVRGSK
jgi:hypothetical protein